MINLKQAFKTFIISNSTEMKNLDNNKIRDKTVDNVDHCMALPTCSTPKRRVEKYPHSTFQAGYSIN